MANLWKLAPILLALLLSLTPLFKGNKKQKRLQAQGMRLMAKPRLMQMIVVACGIFIFGMVYFFVALALADGAWEEAKDGMLLCMALGIVVPALLFLVSYLQYAGHILYDDEKLLLGRAFQDYEQIFWTELGRMEIVDQDFFYLYDREGRRRVSADARYVNYEDFFRAARRHCRPERQLQSGQETGYQKKYAVRSGRGVLRYRTGEYFVLPFLFLLLFFMMFLAVKRSGESPAEAARLWLSMDAPVLLKLIPLMLPVISVLLPLYAALQRIDYDTRGIVIKRALRRTARLRWQEVTRIEAGFYSYQGSGSNLELSLHAGERRYVIRQHQFRKGFPEFEEFVQKMAAAYQIPVSGMGGKTF